MEVVAHPYLEGVLCREDGAIFVPSGGAGRGSHWTFGSVDGHGYPQVMIARKNHKVHRLVCEAFHGLCPSDKCQVDHIDRNKADNRPGNLRWVTRSENQRNRKVSEEVLAKYGVAWADDVAAYRRARYANNPEEREKRKTYMKSYRDKKKKEKEDDLSKGNGDCCNKG